MPTMPAMPVLPSLPSMNDISYSLTGVPKQEIKVKDEKENVENNKTTTVNEVGKTTENLNEQQNTKTNIVEGTLQKETTNQLILDNDNT
eukprot:UN21757